MNQQPATDAKREEGFDGMTLLIPKKSAYPHSFTYERGGTAVERLALKLPRHTPEVATADGGRADVSGMTLFANASSVREWDNDPAYYHVNVPSKNAVGEPWALDLQWSQGHWENPGGITRAEKGEYVVDAEGTERVLASELAEKLQQRRTAMKDYARQRQQERAQSQSPRVRAEGGRCAQASEELQGRAPQPTDIAR